MPDQLSGFRNFVIQKNPNISEEQLSKIDDFINKQRVSQLVSSGQLPLEQAIKPGVADLASQIYSQGGRIPQQQEKLTTEERQSGQELANLETVQGLLRQMKSVYPAGFLERTIGRYAPGLFPNVARYNALIGQTALPYTKALGGSAYPGVVRDVRESFPKVGIGVTERVARKQFEDLANFLRARELTAKAQPGAERFAQNQSGGPVATQRITDPLGILSQ